MSARYGWLSCCLVKAHLSARLFASWLRNSKHYTHRFQKWRSGRGDNPTDKTQLRYLRYEMKLINTTVYLLFIFSKLREKTGKESLGSYKAHSRSFKGLQGYESLFHMAAVYYCDYNGQTSWKEPTGEFGTQQHLCKEEHAELEVMLFNSPIASTGSCSVHILWLLPTGRISLPFTRSTKVNARFLIRFWRNPCIFFVKVQLIWPKKWKQWLIVLQSSSKTQTLEQTVRRNADRV